MGVDAQMFVKTRANLSEKAVMHYAYKLSSTFGPEYFGLWHPSYYTESDPGNRALMIIEKYEQDGPDIVPQPGEQFIQVSLRGRYYGVGYERGDLPIYIAIAEWLERVLPGQYTEVWYGGDSSGVIAQKFDKAAREELFAHFCNVGHDPYEGHFDTAQPGDPVCDLCGVPMNQNGWGPQYKLFTCRGCGLEMETRDGGKTYSRKGGGAK